MTLAGEGTPLDPLLPVPDRIAPESSQFVSAASLRVRLDWFNQLRWGVTAGLLAGVAAAELWLPVPVPLAPLLAVCGLLAVLNGFYTLRNRRVRPVDIRAEIRLVKLQMLCDLLALTALLNLSGGPTNPFYFLYVIHVIIASLLFKGSEIFKIALLAIVLFSTEVIGEYLGLLPTHPLLRDEAVPLELLFVLTTLASFWLVLLFAAFLGASIMKHNRAIKDELVQRQNNLIAADRAKMDFFRFVTHEVKSPVTTAQSAVETALELGRDGLPDQVRDLLVRAVGRLEQATRVVRDLSSLARGEMLKHDVPREVDLGRLVVDVVDMLREQADRRGQDIALHLPAAPVVQNTNGFMVEKIFTNLIGNAVRYNRDGGRVDVTLGRRGDGVRLEVADQGIGIAPTDQERIFDEFFRARNAQETSKLGTGLGLSMVKAFADELGGHVRFASALGEGTTFVCDLPDR